MTIVFPLILYKEPHICYNVTKRVKFIFAKKTGGYR